MKVLQQQRAPMRRERKQLMFEYLDDYIGQKIVKRLQNIDKQQ